MANEVSFFHALRVMSLEEELRKREKIVEMLSYSKEDWQNDYEATEIFKELEADIEKHKASIEEAKADLQEATENKR